MKRGVFISPFLLLSRLTNILQFFFYEFKFVVNLQPSSMNKTKAQFVEYLGVRMEALGRTPMEGRVVALLLISNPPAVPFDEIVEFLQASKSAISNALKTLQLENAVTYITKNGDRRRFFMTNTENWMNKLRSSSENFSYFNDYMRDVLYYRKDMDSPKFNKEIAEILDFQSYLADALEEAVRKWDKK